MHNRSSLPRSCAKLLMRVAVLAVATSFLLSPALAQREPKKDLLDDFLNGPSRPMPKDGSKPGDPHATPPGKRGANSKDGAKDGKSVEADKAPQPIPRSLRRPGGTNVPEGGGQRAALLSELYAYLATATDEDVAKRTADAIEHVWQASIGDTVNLLMERGARAAKDKKSQLAVKLFEQAAALAPDNPEVYSRRALIHYAEGDLERAMGDLRRALALDPNHYRSLENLGQILKELDHKKAALKVYRRLYEVHPFISGAKATIEELAREVEGHGA